jgi:hypothetical protein
VTTSEEDLIDLGSWTAQSVEYALTPFEPGDVRHQEPSQPEPPSQQQPRVAMPASTFDCVRLEALADHPAIDALVRTQLAAGAPFRLIRFPFSLRPPAIGRVIEARFTVRLLGGNGAIPRVHSIFPLRLQVEGDERTTEAAIEPTLEIGTAVQIGTGRLGRKIVARHARSTTVGFWSEDGAEWVVRPPADDDQLEGTWEFLVVVRWTSEVRPLQVALGASAVVAADRRLMPWRTKRVERVYGPIELTGCVSIA